MNGKINIKEYFEKIKNSDNSYIYIEQDYAYNEYGNRCLLDCFQIRIITRGETIYRRDIFFSDFLKCENVALSKCKDLDINPKYIIYDKNREDEMIKIKTIDKIWKDLVYEIVLISITRLYMYKKQET